jgi:hypothetical protein
MSQFYNEPGKARKQCPHCQKYIHARSTVCPACDAELKPGAKEARQVKPVDRTKEGRGRKQCPGCKAYVGVRTQVCSCGNDFSVSAAVVKVKDKTPAQVDAEKFREAVGYPYHHILYAPAGACPIKLKKNTKAEVFKWCEEVMNHYLNDGYIVAPVCLRCLARKAIWNTSQKVEPQAVSGVVKHINLWVKEYVDNYVPVDTTNWSDLSELLET